MSRKCCCCCCNNPCRGGGYGYGGYGYGGGYSCCFGNICNPFCLVVLLIALKKGEIIRSDNTIEALFFLFLLLCCCGGKNRCAGYGGGCGCC